MKRGAFIASFHQFCVIPLDAEVPFEAHASGIFKSRDSGSQNSKLELACVG